MKKLSFFLMAMLFTCATTLQAAEVTETIAMKGFGGLTTSSYENVTKTGTSDLGTEMVAYAFNPTTGQIRGNKTAIAGASVTSADKNKNWSLYNKQAMPGAIKKITVTQTATGSNIFKGNLFVALGTTNQGGVTTVTGAQKNTTGTATEFTFDIDETQGYTYFKLLSNVAFTGGSVAGAVVKVTYVTGDEDPDATMYTVTTKVNDETMGTVTGAGEYAEGKTATLTANPNTGYKFVNWSNGETANPLKLTVTENVEITANFAAIPPMTCAEAAATANGETVVLNPFDVVYVVKDAGYIYIKDESGVNLIYDFNLDDKLKAGDRVEGFIGVSSPYYNLPELKASVSYSDLTVTPGTAPEPTVMAAAPTKADANKYIKFENVTLTANATFTTSSATNATMVVNGTNVTLRNNFKLAATLSKDKAYNIVGFAAIYNSTIQVYFLSAEEYVAPEPCTLATPVNWDAPIAAEANTDQWYAVNVASAIAAGKDLALTVTNPGTEAVEITIEAYADCPATELIVKSTKTFNAGETKTTTVKYDEYLADQVEVVYLHVVTSGDLTIGTEAIEPCSKATAINWDAPIAAAANIDAWYAVNVESAIAAGKDLALTVSNPSTEAVEVSIEAYANCPATELIVKATSTINAGASKTTTVKYDEYLADQVEVVYMHVTTKGGEIKVEAETVKFNVTATAENGTVEGAGIYEQGAEATLTAKAAEGYEFVNWTVDGTEVSTENPYKFTVTADVALVANFKEVVIEEPLPEGVPTQEELWASFQTAAGLSLGTLSEIAASTNPVPCKVICTPLTATEVKKAFANAEWAWLKNYIKEVQNAQKGNPVATSTVPELTDDLTTATWRYAIAAFFLQTQYAAWPYSADFTEAGKPQAWGPYYLAAQQPAEPATETVYFINTKKWSAVKVHAWGGKAAGTSWPGLATVKETEKIAGFDVYSFTANAGAYANVIFNNNNGGSQTGDLVWTAGKYYVIDFDWLTKEEAETKLAAPLPETWNIVGAAGLMGKDWDLNAAENAMTKQADGTYLLEKKDITLTAGSYEYKAAKDHGWDVAVPQNGNQTLTISKSGIYDITFVLNVTAKTLKATATLKKETVVIPTVIIAGDMNGWDQNKDKFTMAADSLTATFKATLAVKNYGFKMIVGGAWHSDGKTITRAANSTKFTGANSNTNSTLKADIAGEYLFTWEYATKTLTVTYPALPVKYNVTVTAENGTVEGAGAYEEGKTATLTATANEGYEFVNWTVGEEVVSTENPYSFVVTADVALVANFKAVEPEIEWLEMPLEITNLTTEVMEVEGAKYLLLQGRDDMNDADVMLFLNNYADVDDDYEVNAESSYMTFGGLELTVLEGVMTQTSETDKGTMYNGIVRTYVAEDSLYVAFNLTMYAAPATVIELTDAIVAINEDLGTLTFNVATDEGGYMAELSGYTGPGVHEGPQICLFETPEVVAYTNYAETSVADGVITLKGEFTSFMGPKFDVTISGKLPVEEPVEKPEPTYTENNLNPYAFGLESKLSDDKSTLTMTYRLNNSKATDVDVVVKGGDEVIIIVNGTTNIGKNTVEISTEGFPGGVDITWSVIVKGTSVEAPTQEAKEYMLYHPSSVDIDNNPENATFGMLLVNEAMQSVKTSTSENPYISKGFGAGIFAFTPSFDLIPNGDQPGYNGGKTFSTVKNDFAPRRIRFSEDGRIFATAQDGSGEYLWEINPENLNDWTTVFQGTNDGYTLKDAEGNFIAGTNSGFDVRGEGENLQLLMLSASLPGAQVGSFKCHTYDLGTATTWATVPTKEIPGANYMLVTNQSNAQFDKDGGVWYIQYRGTTTEKEPGLVHINKDGVEDFKWLRHYTRNAGFRFNDDFSKVVIAGVTSGANERKATVYAVSQDENGAPVLTEEFTINTTVLGSNLNDFAWDYAGNLYACGNSNEKIVAWALPYSGEVETPAASKYAFQLEGTGSEYQVYEDEITNLVIDLDNLVLIGGPSSAFQVDVYLPLGEYNMSEDSYQLTSESSIAVMGSDATFIEGYAYEIDAFTPSAKAVVRCEWNGMLLEFHLTMTAEPMEATKVVVENATVEIEKYIIFGDVYDYALKMTGNWINPEDGLTYPVLVEVPVYYPEATEPSEIMSTVTVGGWGDNDPWLGFGEGTLTVTTADNVVTATGIVQNPMAGVAIDITISGKINNPGLALDNATVVIKSIKKIQNGQLIIEKDGVQYNAQGATVK